MSTQTRCRRLVRRYTISEGAAATVEFTYPGPKGPRHDLSLVDVSTSGLSFVAGRELAGVDSGTTIPEVVVRFGGCEMRGEMLVMHVTSRTPEKRTIGALFYPAQDTDLVKWKSVVAGIEAVQTT
jgi:ribulose 1,5-bisphosphate synthetase/thiazole synthase